MKVLSIKNIRQGFATNSSSTHSVIFRKDDDSFSDLNIGDEYYERYGEYIAASKTAKALYIFHSTYTNKTLSELLANKYPEIKTLFEDANKSLAGEYRHFGSDYRDWPMCDNDILNYEFLCSIIDNDELVIVAGSDEQDFVFDLTEGHKEVDLYGNILKRNGNYYISQRYGDKFVKRRLAVTDELIPSYPELIDLKITNCCSADCGFCYQKSHREGNHADWSALSEFIDSLPSNTELAIGGGDITTYPKLKELFKRCERRRHIINTTVDVKCIDRMGPHQLELIKKYVKGLGVSINNVKNLSYFVKYLTECPDQYIVAHVIPEMLGFEKAKELVNTLNNIGANILLLGYKSIGRARTLPEVNKFTDEQVTELLSLINNLSVDTLFANTYKEVISDKYHYLTVHYTEGEFSMYVDMVEQEYNVSSYCESLPNRYEYQSIVEMFDTVRTSIGLKPTIKNMYEV